MPGILGIIDNGLPDPKAELLAKTISLMEHESFYRSTLFSDPLMGVQCARVGFSEHESAGEALENGSILLVLAGECFPDPDSATKEIARLYEEQGDRFVESLNGMFSGLLIDKSRRRVLLFSDRYGGERVYFHETANQFFFASEAKALLGLLPQLREFSHEGLADFFTYGCTTDGRTLFRGIHVLPPASLWTFEQDKVTKRTYFDFQAWEKHAELSPSSFEMQLEDVLERVTPRYFESDSLLGISLTGGLDTRMIMACRPRQTDRLVSYTFTGRSDQTLDDRVAAMVADTCNISHQLIRLGPDFFSAFNSHADRTVYITDGCLGVSGAHEIYFNRQARQLAPIRLTGLFGSEILRGVSTLKASGSDGYLLNPELHVAMKTAGSCQDFRKAHPVTMAVAENIPWNLFGSLAAARSQLAVRTPYLDNDLVALAYQTPETLRKSPRPALEFLDKVDPRLSSIPTDRRIEDRDRRFPGNLRHLMLQAGFKLDYLYNEGMPHGLSRFDFLLAAANTRMRFLGYHKYLHYRAWFRKELKEYVGDIISSAAVRQSRIWNGRRLEEALNLHMSGKRNYVSELNTALTLEAVERLLFRELPRGNKISCDLGARPDRPWHRPGAHAVNKS